MHILGFELNELFRTVRKEIQNLSYIKNSNF